MQKARLGFKIYSLDKEMLVDEDKDFERKEKDQVWASRQKMLARKLRCYNKHKEKYNAQRREQAATIAGRYKSSKTKALQVGQEWNLSQDEWQNIWMDAGWVIIPGTVSPSSPMGVRRTAYAMRGPNKFTNTMMARTDLNDAWSVENCYIVFRCAPLEGSIYHTDNIG
jgi:hypothetical protein